MLAAMNTQSAYDPQTIEPTFQQQWFADNVFKSTTDASKPKYYVLEMLPYPSGQLHMGHVRNYTLGDVLARYKRAAGFNVIHPMGWDAFGLPAENAALKRKVHPQEWTLGNIAEMKKTMQRFGWSYDWDREVASCLPDYYGNQQKLFLALFQQNLAYQKESIVNWDPVENTVLANEQVVDGKGWRSGVPVERRTMHQWHFKITAYAQELLDDLDNLPDWPHRVKVMQENWIGRSEGLKFSFEVTGWDQKLEVYTTRPDTIYGATFCAIAPEHPLAKMAAQEDAQARSFVESCQALGTSEEALEQAEKKGYPTKYTAKHPLTGAELPIYIANFVLMTYGTGAIMAVPAHDARDHAFATKYDLPIVTVIEGAEMPENGPYAGAGVLVNSGEHTGLANDQAKAQIIDLFEQKGIGERTVNWRLRDWGLSRQRYWGCPIPIVHCSTCGTVPVPREQLPVVLPTDVTFDQPGNPLDHHPTWKYTPCPTCGKEAVRETDTMDTFVDSSWYFMRYCSPNAEVPLEQEDLDYWMPKNGGVDQYIGGIEHAVLHLLYARFFTKALRDAGYVQGSEPFQALLCQGMLIGNSYQDSTGAYHYPSQVRFEGDKAFHKETGEELRINPPEKISKSKNNGDAPDSLVARYGADTLRLYMLFTAPPERDLEWSEQAIEGAWRFMNRLWVLAGRVTPDMSRETVSMDTLETRSERDVKRKIHQTIKKVTQDIERFHYNTMVAAVMELANTMQAVDVAETPHMPALFYEGVATCLRLLNPAVPHITEALWQQLQHDAPLHSMPWLSFDTAAAQDEEITLVVQINGKLKEKLIVPADISDDDAKAQALSAVAEWVKDKEIKKCIVVPKRLVNVVAI